MKRRKFYKEPPAVRPAPASIDPTAGRPPVAPPPALEPPKAPPAADPKAGPAAAAGLGRLGATPRRAGGAGSNKPSISMRDATKAYDKAMGAKQKELEKELKAETDSSKKAAIQAKLDQIKADRKSPPQNLNGLEKSLAANGIDEKMVPQEITDAKDERAAQSANAAQGRLADAQRKALEDPDSPDNKSKLAQAESARDQGKAALMNAETQKDGAGAQKFSAYAQGASAGLQGIGAAVNAGVAIANLGTQERASIRQQVTQLEASKEQARTAEKQLRGQKEARRDQMAEQRQQAADSKYGTKNRAPDSAGAALAKMTDVGTNPNEIGGQIGNKGLMRGPNGAPKNPNLEKREQTIAQHRAQRQQEDENRRRARPEPSSLT